MHTSFEKCLSNTLFRKLSRGDRDAERQAVSRIERDGLVDLFTRHGLPAHRDTAFTQNLENAGLADAEFPHEFSCGCTGLVARDYLLDGIISEPAKDITDLC